MIERLVFCMQFVAVYFGEVQGGGSRVVEEG